MTVKSKLKSHKIGLYIRVSTEEQAANPEGSIKSQEQRLREHVEYKNSVHHLGEIAQVFIDQAKSGKDTNRPELQKLLKAIREGKITLLLVTELSRLSRSLKDFCSIWELLKDSGCEFQSLREQFDTTTAAGEMVLYTMANINQFERRQCSERVSANFLARAKRGLFNGGSVPFGYDLDPDKKGYLNVNPSESKVVKEVFKSYLKERSLAGAGKSLNDRGIRLNRKRKGGGLTRLGHFTPDNLHDMLTNRTYVGERVFTINGEQLTSTACWPAIVDLQSFEEVQQLLKSNYRRNKKRLNSRYPYLLSGKIFCGKCKDRLPGKSAHGNGGKIPYYEHAWATKNQAFLNKKVFKCSNHMRFQAKLLEPAIWNCVIDLLNDPVQSKILIEKAQAIHQRSGHQGKLDALLRKLRGTEEQLDALGEHLSKIPKNVSPDPIYRQMEKLEDMKRNLKKEMQMIEASPDYQELPTELSVYQRYLKQLKPLVSLNTQGELKQKIIELLVHKIEAFPDAYKVHFYVGSNRFENKVLKKEEGPLTGPSLSFFSNRGSNSLTNGRADWI